MMSKKQIYFDDGLQIGESKLLLENPENILSEFGLSKNQTKVYLFLNKFGSNQASYLSKSLDIPRTEIYAILKLLQKKGCIKSKNEKPMKFEPISFEEFLGTIIKSKKEEIQRLEETLGTIKTLKSNIFCKKNPN